MSSDTQGQPIGWTVAAATVTAVFVVDLMTQLGIAVPMLYVLPLVITWFVPGGDVQGSSRVRRWR